MADSVVPARLSFFFNRLAVTSDGLPPLCVAYSEVVSFGVDCGQAGTDDPAAFVVLYDGGRAQCTITAEKQVLVWMDEAAAVLLLKWHSKSFPSTRNEACEGYEGPWVELVRERIHEENKTQTCDEWTIFRAQIQHWSCFGIVELMERFCFSFLENPPFAPEQPGEILSFVQSVSADLFAHPLWDDHSYDGGGTRRGVEKYIHLRIHSVTFMPEEEYDEARDQEMEEKLTALSFIKPRLLGISSGSTDLDATVAEAKIAFIMLDNMHCPADKMFVLCRICHLLESALPEEDTDFVPLFAYTLMQNAPQHLVSTLTYLNTFVPMEDDMYCTREEDYVYWIRQLQSTVAMIESMSARDVQLDEDVFTQLQKATLYGLNAGRV